MRRVLLTLLGLACAVSVALSNEVEAADDARSLLSDCAVFSGYNRSWCRSEQTRFVDLYRRSLERDYYSQRSVASCLFGGCDGAVTVDKRQACAWRLLILQSGYEFVDSTDNRNYRSECAGLDTAEDVRAVRSRANALMMRIYDKPLASTP